MNAVDLHFAAGTGGLAQLVLDGLLLVPSASLDLRPAVAGDERSDVLTVVLVDTAAATGTADAGFATYADVPAGAVAVFDRLPDTLAPAIESLARRLSGAAVTCLDDVDRLTPLVDGPVAYVGTPVPGELLPATDDEGLTILLGAGGDTGPGCPGCRWSERFGPLPSPVRILSPAVAVAVDDVLCPSCRPQQAASPISVGEPWALPGLLRGQVVLVGDRRDPLHDVACRVAETTGRPGVDLSGRAVPQWGDDPSDRELLMVAKRMEGLLLEVMHRRSVRVTAEHLGTHFSTRPGTAAVAGLVGTAFGELFGRALESTPHPVHAEHVGVPQPRTS